MLVLPTLGSEHSRSAFLAEIIVWYGQAHDPQPTVLLAVLLLFLPFSCSMMAEDADREAMRSLTAAAAASRTPTTTSSLDSLKERRYN